MTDLGPEVNDFGDRERLTADSDTVAIQGRLPLAPHREESLQEVNVKE
jgi:hypothetical protein